MDSLYSCVAYNDDTPWPQAVLEPVRGLRGSQRAGGLL